MYIFSPFVEAYFQILNFFVKTLTQNHSIDRNIPSPVCFKRQNQFVEFCKIFYCHSRSTTSPFFTVQFNNHIRLWRSSSTELVSKCFSRFQSYFSMSFDISYRTPIGYVISAAICHRHFFQNAYSWINVTTYFFKHLIFLATLHRFVI